VAIAGWLLIGIALLLLVAVINNSWRPLLDQFRGVKPSDKGGAVKPSDDKGSAGLPPVGSAGRIDTGEGPPLELPSRTPLPLEIPPADVVEPGEPSTATA
jgi:hypothetical protein